MKRLQRMKQYVVRKALPKSDHVPEQYWSAVSAFPMSYSVGRSIIDFCNEVGIRPGESRVLIVGAHGGRDYYWLSGFGHKVDVLDLGDHNWGKTKYVGDACRAETWEQIDEKYDLIVMHDVLEHLPEDFAALRYSRNVLKDAGFLFYLYRTSMIPRLRMFAVTQKLHSTVCSRWPGTPRRGNETARACWKRFLVLLTCSTMAWRC